MSELKAEASILSRQELQALLESLTADEDRERKPWDAAAQETRRRGSRHNPGLRRLLEQFAEDQTRIASNAYQAPIVYRLAGWEEMRLGELADLLQSTDRVAMLSLAHPNATGFMVLNRPYLFAMLGLVFGAPPGTSRGGVPARRYTRIEERLFERICEGLLEDLQRTWKGVVPATVRLAGLHEPDQLREEARSASLVATFEVGGLGEVCLVRVALPPEAFESLDAQPRSHDPSQAAESEQAVRGMPVDLAVELGTARLPLSRLADLRVGAVIPVDPSDEQGLLVRVEGRPKFRAQRGRLGDRLAVQVLERL